MAAHCSRFRLAAMYGTGVKLHPGACEAYAELFAKMATQLDATIDVIEHQAAHISILERQVAILSDNVTSEGNHV